MLVNLTGAGKDDLVVQGRNPRTLKQLVIDVYNHGRSKILHGNRYDRMDERLDGRIQFSTILSVDWKAPYGALIPRPREANVATRGRIISFIPFAGVAVTAG